MARLMERMMPSSPRRSSASSASAIAARSAATEGRKRVRMSKPNGRISARSIPSVRHQRRRRAEVDADRPAADASHVLPYFRLLR
jgi:hypothetical protein